MTALPLADRTRRGIAQLRQLGGELTEAFGTVWRRSLQMRVVISTLALSTAVVLVLGLILQTQIALRVLQAKEADTLARAEAGRVLLERDLSGVDPDREGAQGELNNALDRLTNNTAADDPASPAAGEYRAVLTTARGDAGTQVAAGPVEDVPLDLREKVAEGTLSRKYVTLDEQGIQVPTLLVGQPVRTANGDLEFYLLFPLTAEERTLDLVQSTLIVGGLILLLLLAGIASLVTRQVVRPVRQAAEIAERFADGHLDERMPVHGEDELARLGESYNAMAQSIEEQIRKLEEFGALQRRFTSDVSHELRTPLTTVRMAADVLHASRAELLPALRRSSELLVSELDRFEALLADLLEISRLDAGVADLGAERVDVHARGGAGRRGGARDRRRERDRAAAGRPEPGVRRGRPAPGGAHRAQPGGQRGRPRRGPAGADRAGLRRAHRRGAGPRPRRRAAPGRGGAGVQPVLAGRGVARPAQRRQRAGAVDRGGGRPAARRLAAGLGRDRAGRRVPADAAPRGGRHRRGQPAAAGSGSGRPGAGQLGPDAPGHPAARTARGAHPVLVRRG